MAELPPLSHAGSLRRQSKQQIADLFLQNLRQRGNLDVDAPGSAEDLRAHFESLPSRYALDVNISSLDVLNHKRLLDSARADPSAVSFQLRPVDVVSGSDLAKRPSFGSLDALQMHHESLTSSFSPHKLAGGRPLPRPAFGSSPNLQALVLEAEEKLEAQSGGGDRQALAAAATTFYEVTIASIDQPKLLSRLSESLGDLGLNICEAHAFNTKDRFSLDVFVVNGWAGGGTEELEDVLSRRLQELPPPVVRGASASPPASSREPEQRVPQDELAVMAKQASASTSDNDWELDPHEIVFHEKIASGAFGDLFRGTYCGQDVAIKILRNVHEDTQQFQEFLQEVAIMRKVRHKNIVQFIGACTQKPNLCIVFEFMSNGSVYDYIRKAGPLRVGTVLKVAVEVCRGMDYLHKRKIVHRDLKAANLLLDETGTVKIADFGVARVMDHTGIMTAETGTYRWMAPEVIEHNPYKEKADVFSFGIVLWELLTGRIPYSDMTPLQAAVGVVQKGLRPPIPPNCPPPLSDIMRLCWQRDPNVRPSFEQLKVKMQELLEVYRQQDGGVAAGGIGGTAVRKVPQAGAAAAPPSSGSSGGLLARLRASGSGSSARK
ncbi:Tyrosine-kinase isoform SRK1 [Micractinium conductrix]|uniref:non-specific serine/threonine protein kinase n=1 Tax=Micractinium conductrix TaxID=554055 RepID=A0A2P6VNT9_9CHLO|nr:Tyrosine-kinase isoform SRK1 [Micractinium conductrix]|eukprot:PSC75761.1 Tyrosine-kinase isoform SRK1 [Micractinium conductrix]